MVVKLQHRILFLPTLLLLLLLLTLASLALTLTPVDGGRLSCGVCEAFVDEVS